MSYCHECHRECDCFNDSAITNGQLQKASNAGGCNFCDKRNSVYVLNSKRGSLEVRMCRKCYVEIKGVCK